MAKHKTMEQLQDDLALLNEAFALGWIKPRPYRRKKGHLIERIKKRVTSAGTGTTQNL